MNALHPLVKAGRGVRLRLHVRDILGASATAAHATVVVTVSFGWSLMARLLEITLIG